MDMITPLRDRVVVEPIEVEKMSAGGIVLTESSVEKPFMGRIVKLGEYSKLPNGDVRAFNFDVGVKCVYRKGAGTEVPIDGKKYLVMHEDEIVCLLGESEND